MISDLKSPVKIEYIQQKDEYDYLRCFIENIDEGTCVGILLHGPPGTGKTLLAISLANTFEASYYIIDGSPDLDRRDIEGNWELLKGETKFNYGPLTLAIKDANQRGISFVIINEINAIRENEQISLNSLLSENHINLISKGFERHELDSKSKLVIIGTMNKGVVGVNKLQEAFEDRFVLCPEINYPLRNKEIDIAMKMSQCSKTIAEIVVEAARQIRKQAIKDFSITKIFSTRLVVNFCSLVVRMPTKFLKHNIENVILNKLGNSPEEKKSIAMILDGKMFESKLKEELFKAKEKLIWDKTQDYYSVEEIIKKTKVCFDLYSAKYGQTNSVPKNGRSIWKTIEWMWQNHKIVLQEYFKLTEMLNLPTEYKQETGKEHIYNGKLTFRYIRWLFQRKPIELNKFMRKIFPVL